MKEIKIITTLQVYESIDELPKDIQTLMKDAIEARDKAYAPYSNFHVGAALRLSNGIVIKGNNQENAAFPSGMCAERTAIYYAGANYPNEIIEAMALSASSAHQVSSEPIPPCGACRQAIAEYEIKQKQPIEIYFMGAEGNVIKSNTLANLLPLVFDKSML